MPQVQRRHFEERLGELDRAHKRHLREVEKDLRTREERLRFQHDAVEREARASARRVQHAEKAATERDFSQQLNDQLMRNQGALRERLTTSEAREAELQSKVADMEEQVRAARLASPRRPQRAPHAKGTPGHRPTHRDGTAPSLIGEGARAAE